MARHLFSSALWLSAVIAPLALAEGAVRELACSVNKTCDADGICQDAGGDITFRMEPVTVTDDASGTYLIRYQDQQFDMQSLSFAGPFHWAADNEMNTLLVSSETQFIWHHLSLHPNPVARIQFLTCRFIQ